jgi:hypothetical protein
VAERADLELVIALGHTVQLQQVVRGPADDLAIQLHLGDRYVHLE